MKKYLKPLHFLVSSQSASVAIPSLIINTSGNNNTDLDDLTYNIKYENNIDKPALVDDNGSGISLLVFYFSNSAPIPSNDELMNLEFIKIIKKFNIFRDAHEKITTHFNRILERSVDLTYKASTPYYASELLKLFLSIKKKKYDICHKGYMLFNEANITACSNCSEPRYKEDSDDQGHANKLVPVMTMVQLLLDSQLCFALINKITKAEMQYYHLHRPSQYGTVSNVFDGQAYQRMKHLFSAENDIAISLSVDGFASHNIPGSVTIVHTTILNLLPMIHYERSHIIQIAMISELGAPANFWSYMKPTIDNLFVLQQAEMVIKILIKTIQAKVHVLMIMSNIPALAKLACHVGHMSKSGCRICNVVGETPGRGQYFQTFLATTICTKESFQNYNETSPSDRIKLNRQSSLAKLSFFSGPLFFALAEMHGLCHGIAKQVWELVCDKYGEKNSLVLCLATQREIGAAIAMTRSTVPTLFHGVWINVSTRSGYFRAVYWANFFLFIVPTRSCLQPSYPECTA
ncbi:hypothetical protein PHYBLDRAFT_67527 [Phycomyces blakesleeanus NRRL 1555(-)]|uniref:Uncharacterized protein n=1 Tax=Phycomyces blakesleeanus (strain ATCC 8743b / DSM 1359 / FGSC 10004 / NBRC 33097 / NRRL 1555) TaxID=763407 RepID=A0A167MYR6_PHYB8|nr:hypothetical protein PHYBLDRAFT_67527 [Phycomyces blakesleeanus NRRL 1555(-)]OAD74554.1 hypothetical protein PHYBLDRAFT_67527 [Phycomyces blakesleeanus NRRL 1555(-)]|eukprot:XP_018292594.1 hypothetical protein PHYBLDRAFT_67527 [Phycomyces blakesleeanus NRRL 1555(-)]